MSQTKLVTYDLIADKDYKSLIAAIESYNHVKINLSTYAVETSLSHGALFEDLSSRIDKDDRLFVVNLQRGATWRRMIGNDDAYKAMKKD